MRDKDRILRLLKRMSKSKKCLSRDPICLIDIIIEKIEKLPPEKDMVKVGVLNSFDGSVFVYNSYSDENRKMAERRAKWCGGTVIPVSIHVDDVIKS